MISRKLFIKRRKNIDGNHSGKSVFFRDVNVTQCILNEILSGEKSSLLIEKVFENALKIYRHSKKSSFFLKNTKRPYAHIKERFVNCQLV